MSKKQWPSLLEGPHRQKKLKIIVVVLNYIISNKWAITITIILLIKIKINKLNKFTLIFLLIETLNKNKIKALGTKKGTQIW